MDRRAFLTALAAGAAGALTGCVSSGSRSPQPRTGLGQSDGPGVDRLSAAASEATLPRPTYSRPAPVVHVSVSGGPSDTAPALLDRLVGGHNRLALTVDDGVSTEVVSAYVDFVAASAIRLTFFVNGVNSSWTAVRAKLAPLVESGQVQLANHTWNHPSITRLSRSEIAEQLERNEKFLRNTYGVEGRPYFRPPYGRHNAWTDRVTAEHGFTETVLWWGSLGDAQPISGAQILALARTWFRPERIVIGHANHPGVMTAYPQLLELIRERSLQTVTLRDAFAGAQLAH